MNINAQSSPSHLYRPSNSTTMSSTSSCGGKMNNAPATVTMYASPTRKRRGLPNIHTNASPMPPSPRCDYSLQKLPYLASPGGATRSATTSTLSRSPTKPMGSSRSFATLKGLEKEQQQLLTPIKEQQSSTFSQRNSNLLLLRVTLLSVATVLALAMQCSILAFHSLPDATTTTSSSPFPFLRTRVLQNTVMVVSNTTEQQSAAESEEQIIFSHYRNNSSSSSSSSSSSRNSSIANDDSTASSIANTANHNLADESTTATLVAASTAAADTNPDGPVLAAVPTNDATVLASTELDGTPHDSSTTETEAVETLALPVTPLVDETTNQPEQNAVPDSAQSDNTTLTIVASPSTSPSPRFCYVYIVGGCDPARPVYRNYLYNIMINTRTMRQHGSNSTSDVVVYIQMSHAASKEHEALPPEDVRLLSALGIELRYIPSSPNESFALLQFQKFRVLGMSRYERVLYLDADIILRTSLDYLMEWSVQGVLQQNVVFAGRYVPATGGLFIVTPGGSRSTDRVDALLASRNVENDEWNTTIGWGHAFDNGDDYELVNGKRGKLWKFRGVDGDQGLLYHWTKYEAKSVSIVMRDSIQNYGIRPALDNDNGSGDNSTIDSTVRLMNTLSLDALNRALTTSTKQRHPSCWETYLGHKPCVAPHADFLNFPGAQKVFLHPPPVDYQTHADTSPAHYWFYNLALLNDEFNMGLDLDHWQLSQRPLLGYQAESRQSLDRKAVAVSTVPDSKEDEEMTMATPKFVVANLQQPTAAKSTADFAYTYVVGGCDPDRPAYRNFIYNILINTHLQRQEGSTADVLIFLQMSHDSLHHQLPEHEARILHDLNIQTVYIPPTEHESFERLMFDKFRVLGLTHYKRVLFLDADIMVRGSLDYLFDLSMQGVLKENVVFAGRLEPAAGGIFMLAPRVGDWQRILEIIRDKENRGASLPPPYFDESIGWGHPFGPKQTYELVGGRKRNTWDFVGASSDQGLLYSWVRFEPHHGVSIVQKDSIQNFVNGNLVETLDIAVMSNQTTTTHPPQQRTCWTASLAHKPCVPPHSDYVHFPGQRHKPWMAKSGLPADLFDVDPSTSPAHFWFRTLATLNDQLQLGLDFSNWDNTLKPLLGVRPNDHALAGTTYAESVSQQFISPYTSYKKSPQPSRFAYAYVVGGCKPEDPSYRNYFNDILVSTYLQRQEGSTADVVIFVQMAFESTFDALPETDVNLLSAASILVQYIDKAEDESFYRIMMDKFRVLTLTQYDRVLFMDADVMALGNLDYLFDWSVRSVIKQHLVMAGKLEPANGGFFMVTPSADGYQRLLQVMRDTKERGAQLPYPHWDAKVGWGHAIQDSDGDAYELLSGHKKTTWDFYGAFADQGLLYHYTKYEQQSVSIVFRNTIQNWDVDAVTGKVHLEQTLNLADVFGNSRSGNGSTGGTTNSMTTTTSPLRRFKRHCWKEVMTHKPCLAPHSDSVHFTGIKKPWLRGPPDDLKTTSNSVVGTNTNASATTREDASSSSPWHYWFATLSVLNDQMQMGLDFNNWRAHHRPTLGLFPTQNDAALTTYATSSSSSTLTNETVSKE